MALTGCSAPSLLITPVSGRRALVETVIMRESAFAVDKIALIDVSGVILNVPRPQLLGEGENAVSLLLEQLDKARRDRYVKAVILRINSPGGSVVASRLMYDEILHFRKSGKPVIAIMMDVAASGGYYIACACDAIMAQSSTITGSIGVIMQLFDMSETMNKIGIKGEAITSGTHKDTGSPFRPMRPEERKLFQSIVDEMYNRFVEVVVRGRPDLDRETVKRLADGRVYTGLQAVQLGLIDRIANMRETIRETKKRIGAKSVRVVAYKRPATYRPNYYARAPRDRQGDVNLVKLDLPSWLTASFPRFLYVWSPGRVGP